LEQEVVNTKNLRKSSPAPKEEDEQEKIIEMENESS